MQPQNPGGQGRKQQLRVELPNNLQPIYANGAMVTQTHSEIVLDFLQIMPNDPRARIQARIAMTPANAKLFLRALEQNLARYEEKHGEISLPAQPPSLADQLFGSLAPGDEEGDNGGDGEGQS
jgi:hypothetical protein